MKNLFSSILLLGAVALVIWLVSDEGGTILQEPVTRSAGIDAYMNQFTMRTMTEDGRPAMRISAARMEVDDEAQQAALRSPDIQIIDSSRQRWRITADDGAIDNLGKIVELNNNVEITNTDGEPLKIETEQVLIEVDAQRITSEREVLMTMADTRLSSLGMVIDNLGGTLELLSDVRGQHVPE